MWFALLGIVSDSAFPAFLQNLNSTVYVFCSYVQNVYINSGDIEKEPADKSFFPLDKNIEYILSLLKIILTFVSSLPISYLKTNRRKNVTFIFFMFLTA